MEEDVLKGQEVGYDCHVVCALLSSIKIWFSIFVLEGRIFVSSSSPSGYFHTFVSKCMISLEVARTK